MAEEIEEDKEVKIPDKERKVEKKLPEEKPSEKVPSEEEPLEEEQPEDKPLEGEPSEEQPPKEERPEEKLPEEEPSEEEPLKEEQPEEEPPEEGPSEEQPQEKPSEEEPPKEEQPEDKPPEEELFEEQPPKEGQPEDKPPEEEPSEEPLPKEEQPEDKPPEEEPLKEEQPEDKPPEEEPFEEQLIKDDQHEEKPTVKEPSEKAPIEEEPLKEGQLEEKPPEEEPSEEQPPKEGQPQEKPSEEEPPKEEQPEDKPPEEEPSEEQPPKEGQPQEKPLKLEEVKGYDADELKKEIEGVKIPDKEERSPEFILSAIQEERKRLQEEREKLREEMDQKEKMLKKKEEKEEEEEKKPSIKSKAIKSFVKERRKRKELERLKDYLFYGEYALLVVLIMALLYTGGTSFNPLYLPIESSIYLIIVFFLIIKVETFYFRFLNMKYSGTVQRKAIGVEHFKAIEYPSMMLNVFLVAILLVPITSMIINLVIDMISFDREYIPFSSGFTFNLAMFFLASLIVSIAWLIFLIRYRNKVIVPELEKIAEPFVIEDLFVITNSGLLLSHISKDSKPDVDEDILSSMLTAVKEFVKDSFGSSSEEGELDELQYGKTRIIIEYGKDVYLAAVVRGQESMEFRPEMKKILKQIHRKFGRVFDTWDGDMGQLRGIERLTHSLVESV